MNMLKRFAALIACAATVFFVSTEAVIPAEAATAKAVILDTAGFIPDSQEPDLLTAMQAVADETGWNIGVVSTALDVSNYDGIENADDYYDEFFGVNSSGILYYMDSANHNYFLHFAVEGNARDVITDAYVDRISDAVVYEFEDYREADSVYTFLEMVTTRYRDPTGSLSSYSSSSFDVDAAFETLGFLVVVALIATGIAAITVWNRYHKHAKINAAAYLKQGSINIYNRSDRFIRQYTTRTRRSDNSSGGSHGGHSHHSGGHRHGGGGVRGRR